MSTQILNFKKTEVVAESKNAAIAQVEETLFHVNGDATQAYKNWLEKQNGAVTERAVKEFMLDYLSKKTKNCPNAGFIICVDAAVADTRERPYRIENVKGEGKRKYKTTYVAVDVESGATIMKCDTNKADALNMMKELYKTGEYKGNFELHKVKEVIEGQAVVAKGFYTPSKNAKKGRWIAFGIEA
jgi:hypothetical protein